MERPKSSLGFGGCLGIALLTVVGLLAVLTVIGSHLPPSQKAAGGNDEPFSKADLIEAFRRQLTVNISKLGLKTGLLRVDRSHYWQGPFIISNTLDVPIKDVLVTCSFYGQSGTKIEDRSVRIYESFPAHSERTTRPVAVGYVSGQTDRFSCRITDLNYDTDAIRKKFP